MRDQVKNRWRSKARVHKRKMIYTTIIYMALMVVKQWVMIHGMYVQIC